jgi:hypothetical protein
MSSHAQYPNTAADTSTTGGQGKQSQPNDNFGNSPANMEKVIWEFPSYARLLSQIKAEKF